MARDARGEEPRKAAAQDQNCSLSRGRFSRLDTSSTLFSSTIPHCHASPSDAAFHPRPRQVLRAPASCNAKLDPSSGGMVDESRASPSLTDGALL